MKRKGRVGFSCIIASAVFLMQNVTTIAADPLEYTGPQLDPYKGIEAELNFGTSGYALEEEDVWTRKVICLEKGDYFYVNDVNFDKGLSKLKINARGGTPAIIEVRRDKEDGRLLGEIKINKSKKYDNFACPTDDIYGKNNIYFVCTMGTCYIDAWIAEKKAPAKEDINKPPVVVNPYETVETETMENGGNFYDKDGTEYSPISEVKMVSLKNVMFSKGLKGIEITARTRYYDTVMEIHLDDPESEPIARALIRTPEFGTCMAYTSNITGMHDVYFTVNNPVDFDSWRAIDNAPKPKGNNDKPIDPEEPQQPEVSETPEQPEMPETPEQPEVPETPEQPQEPETPQQPEEPAKPALELEGSINDCGEGYQVNFKLTNNSDEPKTGWKITMGKVDINIKDSWCVNIEEDDNLYVITPQGWNTTIAPGQTIEFGIRGEGTLNEDTVRYMIE